jgi:hypothetical protein
MSLISTISELKQYLPVDANTKFASLQPFIKEAESVFVIDLLGQEFYDEILALYEDRETTALSAEIIALLPYIQRCTAYYMQYLSINHISSTFGDMGLRQHLSQDSTAAPRWLQEKVQLEALKNGDIHADKLLAFLEEKATDENDYATWFGSDANTKNSGFIVYSSSIASKFIAINNSRRIFLKLRAKIREIETRLVPKLIGAAQYEQLTDHLKGISPHERNTKLLPYLQPIISKRALFLMLPFLRVQLADNGIFLYSGTDEIQKGALASDTDIKFLRQQLMDGELGYLSDEEELRQFFMDNIDDYPLVKASGVFTSRPDPGPTWTSENNIDNKFFSV